MLPDDISYYGLQREEVTVTHISRRLCLMGTLGGALTLASRKAKAGCLNFLSTDEGPFFPSEAHISDRSDLTRRHHDGPSAEGEIIHVGGKVFGSNCEPLSGVSVVIWQADNSGQYRTARSDNESQLDPNFLYFGRVKTSIDGVYRFKTIMPRPYVYQGLHRARHIHFELIHPRYSRMTSEMYFAGGEDEARREIDEVWQSRDARLRPYLISSVLLPTDRASDVINFPVDDRSKYRFDMSFAANGSLDHDPLMASFHSRCYLWLNPS